MSLRAVCKFATRARHFEIVLMNQHVDMMIQARTRPHFGSLCQHGWCVYVPDAEAPSLRRCKNACVCMSAHEHARSAGVCTRQTRRVCTDLQSPLFDRLLHRTLLHFDTTFGYHRMRVLGVLYTFEERFLWRGWVVFEENVAPPLR